MFRIHICLQLEYIGAERHVRRVDEEFGPIIAVSWPHAWAWRKLHKRVEKAFNPKIRECGCEKDGGDFPLNKLLMCERVSGDLQELQIMVHLRHRVLRYPALRAEFRQRQRVGFNFARAAMHSLAEQLHLAVGTGDNTHEVT